MVGAGLPQIAELAGDAKSYAERLSQFPRIGNLDEADARLALADPARQEGVLDTEDALTRSVDITGGYPYFLHEPGFAVWGVATGDTMTVADVEEALPLYAAKLDTSFSGYDSIAAPRSRPLTSARCLSWVQNRRRPRTWRS